MMSSYESHDKVPNLTQTQMGFLTIRKYIDLIKQDKAGKQLLFQDLEQIEFKNMFLDVSVKEEKEIHLSLFSTGSKIKIVKLNKRGYPFSKSVINEIEVWIHHIFKSDLIPTKKLLASIEYPEFTNFLNVESSVIKKLVCWGHAGIDKHLFGTKEVLSIPEYEFSNIYRVKAKCRYRILSPNRVDLVIRSPWYYALKTNRYTKLERVWNDSIVEKKFTFVVDDLFPGKVKNVIDGFIKSFYC